MKSDWTLRWWDLLVLLLAVFAAGMVVRYALSRGANGGDFNGVAIAEVRVPKPLPELMALLAPGDAVLDSQGRKVAEILSLQPVQPLDALPSPVPLAGRQDMLIKLRISGPLRLVRLHPGFPSEPAQLRAGVWCLIMTAKVECSGLITRVKPLDDGARQYLSFMQPISR
ncbi:MAG: hypothetical protein AB1439_08240 [candidate division FCPU426 bacterium]